MASVRKKSLAVLGIGGTSAAAFVLGLSLMHDGKFARARNDVESARQELALANVQDMGKVFRTVGKVVEPSVVNIQVTKSVKAGRRALPFDEDMLRKFFPDRDNDGQPDVPPGFGDGSGPEDGSPFDTLGTGSGVIMEAQGGSGFILTNNHVAGGASELVVTLSDGRRIKDAKVLGTDAKTDLAVVKIEADKLIPAKWGNSDELERGDFVMAFGSPFGYIGSMTHGIVSALNRQAGILAEQQGYENFIQVDAPINPGNSGGPLTNLRGEVVGVNTAIASRTGGFQGIGFAIPSNQAKFVYAALKEKGKVTRGWLGVSIQDLAREPGMAKTFGYGEDKGVLVNETFSSTPATGKLQHGDIITALNGKPVETVQDLRNTVAATAPGTDLKMKVFRDGREQDVTVKIGEQPENLMAMGQALKPEPTAGPGDVRRDRGQEKAENLGLTLINPTDVLAQRFGLKAGDHAGAMVARVAPRSPAVKAGFREGDLITQVNDHPVKTAQEAADALAKQDLSKGVRFYVITRLGARYVFVEPDTK
jgi:serine protease Do